MNNLHIDNEPPYNQTDHYHCWTEKTPPCGQKIEHLKCCLCELLNPKVDEIASASRDAGKKEAAHEAILQDGQREKLAHQVGFAEAIAVVREKLPEKKRAEHTADCEGIDCPWCPYNECLDEIGAILDASTKK